MSEHTAHGAASRLLLTALETERSAEEVQQLLDAAQVHATLHLADQTRLAALVALWSVREQDAVAMARGGINFGKILEEIKVLVASS